MPGNGGGSHAGIETAKLKAGLDELQAFPRKSAGSEKLAATAALALRLRAALLKCEWAEAASFAPLATELEAVPEYLAKLHKAKRTDVDTLQVLDISRLKRG